MARNDSFVNTVIYKVDRSSLKRVRDTNRALKKEFENLDKMRNPYRKQSNGQGGATTRKVKQDQDAHVKAREKSIEAEYKATKKAEAKAIRDNATAERREVAKQKRLNERADIFVEDKLGGVDKRKREQYRQQLRSEKSLLRQNQLMRNIVTAEKERTAQMRKQGALQRRFSGSMLQMVGGAVSAFAILEGFTNTVSIGMQMESVNKSMIVSSTDAKEAAENMAFVREEAMRLGTPLIEASKSFAKMRAAAGDKLSLDDLKTTFIGVSEAATVLGLSQDDIGGTFLALQQMLSR